MKRLTTPAEIEDARRTLAGLLEARGEWFCAEGRGAARLALRRGEWELRASARSLLLTLWGEDGARAWRVSAWEQCGERLLLTAARRTGAERATLELVPRAAASAAAALVTAARLAACGRLAALVGETLAGADILRAGLSAGARRGPPGRFARVIVRRGRGLLAATGPVVPLGAESADAFLASALIWFEGLGGRARERCPRELWLLAPRKLCEALAERLALLRAETRRAVVLYEVVEEGRALSLAPVPELRALLTAGGPRLTRPREPASGLACRVAGLAPEAIDVVRARHGETLRFRGLAFARVRRVVGHEHLWFGVGAAAGRRLLDESNWPELLKLVAGLDEHRRDDACDRRHALYRAAPEAWLESLLRRDITRLDPFVRLSPLHAQFRTPPRGAAAARPVDLLALRRDGRLVVIELKVSEDSALALQGADYWRRISTYHRAGHIERARLFGDAEISEEPPLVYLVAPLLRFHRSFQTLARCVRPEIEMYRFDINEDWRAGVRVMRRVPLHD